MKFAALIAILSLTALNTAYATEVSSSEDDTLAYCNEQVQLAGIEDANEKAQYVNDCIESFATPSSGDSQQMGQ